MSPLSSYSAADSSLAYRKSSPISVGTPDRSFALRILSLPLVNHLHLVEPIKLTDPQNLVWVLNLPGTKLRGPCRTCTCYRNNTSMAPSGHHIRRFVHRDSFTAHGEARDSRREEGQARKEGRRGGEDQIARGLKGNDAAPLVADILGAVFAVAATAFVSSSSPSVCRCFGRVTGED